MSKPRLPESMQEFVGGQDTVAVSDIWTVNRKDQQSPYGSFWYRAVVCILLSGRIRATTAGVPNMTEAKRLGKEANFNPYLMEQVGKFLVAADVLRIDHQDRYEAGPNLEAFWAHDDALLPEIARLGVTRLVGLHTGRSLSWPDAKSDPEVIEPLLLLFACFRDLALIESKVDRVLYDFAQLPREDLVRGASSLGMKLDADKVAGWPTKINARLRKALIAALYEADWAYVIKHEKVTRWFVSPTGLAMMGLGRPVPSPDLATTYQVQSDLSVLAGPGLALETLLPLFRHANIERIDRVFSFRLDRKRLAMSAAGSQPGEELREALRPLDPLPSTVEDLLGTKTRTGGDVAIRWCSALVKPENSEVLAAIREHPQLKGYIEPGAPPGYLLIRVESRPERFVQRCRDLGFSVSRL